MEPVFRYSMCEVYAHAMIDVETFVPPPFDETNYACLIVLGDRSYSKDERTRLIDLLIESQCRYTVVSGPSYQEWVDSLYESIPRHRNEVAQEDALIMINWDDNTDNPEETVYSLIGLSDYDDVSIRRFLILFLDVPAENASEMLRIVPDVVGNAAPVWALMKWAELHGDSN